MASFSKRPQPFRLQYPLNADQVEKIDQMFEILFKRISQVQQETINASASASTAAAAAMSLLSEVTMGSTDDDARLGGVAGATGPAGAAGRDGFGLIGPTEDVEPPLAMLAGSLTLPFTQGSVLFMGPSGQVAQDNAKLFWDDTNFRLGIGTVAPGLDLHVKGDTNVFAAATAVRVENVNTGNSAYALFDFLAGTNNFRFYVPSQGVADQATYLGNVSNKALNLMTNNAARWTLSAAGHLVPVTDNTYDVGAAGTAMRGVYASALMITAASGNPLTNKNIYLTGTISNNTPVSFYMDAAMTNINGSASGFYLTPSFSLAANSTDVNVMTLPAVTVTLNGFTVTNASTLRIEGTPTNGTTKRSIWVLAGLTELSTLKVNEAAVMLHTGVALTNGAGVGAGTITNAPAAGNPTKWIGVDDNGTTRYIPAW